jgi:uroporphyrinogen-III synthase
MKAAPGQDKPLGGLRVLVGRARHQASALSAGLQGLGAEVIEIPFIEIRPSRSYAKVDAALKRAAEYSWLVLTSVNGVDAFAARMRDLRIGAGLKHLQIAAIGPATRAAIEALGLKVAVIPERYVAEAVVDSLRGKVKGKRVLLARAKVARDVIPRELRKLGATVDVVEAYETVVPARSGKRLHALMTNLKQRPEIVCFTSSSTVRNFVELLIGTPNTQVATRPSAGSGKMSANSPALQRPGKTRAGSSPVGTADLSKLLDGIQLASIGPITSATLRELGLPVHIEAEEYTIPGLIRATRNWAVARRYVGAEKCAK